MSGSFTAVVQRDADWWIGWIEEVPGVNSQGRSREELVDNLRSAGVDQLGLLTEQIQERRPGVPPATGAAGAPTGQ